MASPAAYRLLPAKLVVRVFRCVSGLSSFTIEMLANCSTHNESTQVSGIVHELLTTEGYNSKVRPGADSGKVFMD